MLRVVNRGGPKKAFSLEGSTSNEFDIFIGFQHLSIIFGYLCTVERRNE